MENYIDLESMGILKTTKMPPELAWMSDIQKHIMLVLLLSGEEGVHKSFFKKSLKEEPDCIFHLEVRNYVSWITDKRGRPSHMILTWKGDEVAKLVQHVAKNQSQTKSR